MQAEHAQPSEFAGSVRRAGRRTAARMTQLHVHQRVAVWASAAPGASFDVWFHPALGDSRLTYRHAAESALRRHARVFTYDPPGHGASPPRANGLTVVSAARLWCALVARFSGRRPVVLVGHAMAGLIASRTAAMLPRPPALVIGVEANLTRADAYFTGLAARFDRPAAFHAAFRKQILRMALKDEIVRRFACSLEFADPMTLWRLGRSVAHQRDPSAAFRRLRCPKIHYWDSTDCSPETRAYVERHGLPQRRLDGLGHWPMVKAPAAFYAALLEDIQESGTARG